jgi:rhodanese-related sulfurtransferase
MMRTLLLGSCLLLSFNYVGWGQNPEDFDEMCTTNIKGTVPFLLPEALIEEIANDSSILIMDIRERKEYEVSHLPQAETGLAFRGELRNKKLKEIPKDAQIRLIGSVGIRSEMIGEKLLQAGYSNVKNLYGGIFSWANQGHPLIDKDGNPTTYIHGYNKGLSSYLNIYRCKPVFK